MQAISYSHGLPLYLDANYKRTGHQKDRGCPLRGQTGSNKAA
jgi:hypothetical protein